VNLPTDVTFIAWNVNGLRTVSDRQDIIDCVVKYDIICFTEVWTPYKDDCDSLFSASHTCYVNLRKPNTAHNRTYGGVCVYVRKSISHLIVDVSYDLSDSICIIFDAILFEYTETNVCAFTYVPLENSPVYGDEKDGIVNL
jgi:exonuclease III